MKLITYSDNGKATVGVVTGSRIISMAEVGIDCESMTDLIVSWTPEKAVKIKEFMEKNGETDCGEILRDAEIVPLLLSPIPHPRQDIICLGINYAEHAVEAKHFSNIFEAKAADAVYFSKRATYSQGTGDPIPSHSDITDQLDYECELAVIIGKDATNVSPRDAESYIFGYTVMNDTTARNLQKKHKQWYLGKGLDGFCPMGPCIVTADEIPFPPALNIQSWVNGELRQDSNTELLIHSIPEIISELSGGMTLKAGTIIATGTPKGVGMGMEPPTFLSPGDEVICRVEKIGELKNVVE